MLRRAPRLLIGLLVLGGEIQAQTSSNAGGLSVQPRVGLMQTWTDNLRLTDHDKDAAFVTTLSPGISVVRSGGALRGSLDYTLNGIAYLKSDQPSILQNSLRVSGQAELVEHRLVVDVNGSIGQQAASAFGLQSTPTLGTQGGVTTLANTNSHEVGTLAVSPAWRGSIGAVAGLEVRGNFTRTEVRGTAIGDSRGTGGSLRLFGMGAGVLSWSTVLSTQQTMAAEGRSNRLTSLLGNLGYRPDPDWTLGIDVGSERNDYLATSGQSGNMVGLSAQWAPTARTRINGDWHHHLYGNSHNFGFEHRMSRSLLQWSDTRNVTVGSASAGGSRTNYDQFYQLFTSIEPDPVKRDQLVRAYLQAQGLSPDAPASAGFLSSGPSEVHSQFASLTLQGVRSSLSAQVNRTVTSRLGSGLNQGDLATSSLVEQRSYSLTASHQLTPSSGVSLTASRQQSLGDTSALANRLTSLTANWNGKLGPKFGVQFGARHSRFEGVTAYAENAVYANLTQQF